jgi:hypothetical protein
MRDPQGIAMKDGVCVKCGSHDVYTNSGRLMKRGPFGVGAMPVTFWSVSAMTAYVCGRCGYMERYLDLEGRMTVRRKWKPVSPRLADDPRTPPTETPAPPSDAH